MPRMRSARWRTLQTPDGLDEDRTFAQEPVACQQRARKEQAVTDVTLTTDDLGWLLGATRASIHRRQKGLAKQQRRPFDNEARQHSIIAAKIAGIHRACVIEERLVSILRAAGREDLIEERQPAAVTPS